MNKTTLYAVAMLAVVAVVGATPKTKRSPMSLLPHNPDIWPDMGPVPEDPDMWEPGVLPLPFDPDMVGPVVGPISHKPEISLPMPDGTNVIETIEYCKELHQQSDVPDDVEVCIMGRLDNKHRLSEEECVELTQIVPFEKLPLEVLEDCHIIEPVHTLSVEECEKLKDSFLDPDVKPPPNVDMEECEAILHPEPNPAHTLDVWECEKLMNSIEEDPDVELPPNEVLEHCNAMTRPGPTHPLDAEQCDKLMHSIEEDPDVELPPNEVLEECKAIHQQHPHITLNPDCEELMQNPDHYLEIFPADVIEKCLAVMVQQMAEQGGFSTFLSDLGHWVCSYFKSLFGI